MRTIDLPSPGPLHNSQKLRIEVVKAINLQERRKDYGATYDNTLELFLQDALTKLQALK